MFAIEGMASVVLGFFVWFWLDSKPTRQMDDPEEQTHGQCHDGNSANVKPDHRQADHRKLLKDADPVFCALYFCIQLTIYAATFWLPASSKNWALE